jgi:predicted RNase H-like nuclease
VPLVGGIIEPMASSGRSVAGVDGCRGGWVIVRRSAAAPEPEVTFEQRLAAVIGDERFVAIGIDVPIGLCDAAVSGGRGCDRAARRLLGPRRASSVFSAPVRSVLTARDHAEAVARSRASSPHGIGVSKQCFHLVGKIREVDELMTPALQLRVFEVHPECSFALMSGGVAVAASKKRAAGRRVRLDLLQQCWASGVDLEAIVTGAVDNFGRGSVASDDVIDAMAACWSAERVRDGLASVLAEGEEADGRGLVMRIHA